MKRYPLMSRIAAVMAISGSLLISPALKATAQTSILNEGGFLDPGIYIEHYFYGVPGQQVFIDLNSNDFDTLLTVYGPTGQEIGRNDDYNGTLNSGLALDLSTEGSYRIVVQGYDMNHRGRYRVAVYDNTPQPQVYEEAGFLDPGRYVEHYFDGTAGQTVTISLQSVDFDTYLGVYSPTNRLVDENDDDGGSLNSRLTFTLPNSGRYRLLVQGYSPNDGGRYTLRIE